MKQASTRVALIAAVVLSLPLLGSPSANAQSFSLGADLMSRYIWRGVDFGESFSIQPALEFSAGPLAVGSWASYSISQDGSFANEHDLYFSVALGPVSVGITDYYFPSPGATSFGDFNDKGEGAHYFELNASAGGTEDFPLSISANMFFYNIYEEGEDKYPVYVELGYPFTVEDVDLSVSLGVVPQKSEFYGTGAFGITVIGLSASREIPITDSFSLPISVMYILNPTPDVERSFLVFGVSL